LGLALQRDPELVRRVLDEAGAPKGDAPIALSLDPRDQGPFAAVLGDGGFAGWIPAGADLDGASLVERKRLDELAGRFGDLGKAIEKSRTSGKGGQVHALLRPVVGGGQLVSREDFERVASAVPLLADDVLELMNAASEDLGKAINEVVRIQGASPKPAQ